MDKKKIEEIKNPKNILEYNIPDKKLKKILYDWLRKLSIEKNRSKHTINSYENDLRNFINFLCWHKKNKNISLDELNLMELRRIKEEDFNYKKIELKEKELTGIEYQEIRPYLSFLTYLNYEKKSRKRIISAIKNFYRFLENNDDKEYVGMKIDSRILSDLKGPVAEESLPRPIDIDVIWKIINKIWKGNKYKTEWIKQRDIAIILIMWGTGLRIDETLSIKYHQIPTNSSKCLIKVIGKGKKDREVLLLPIIMRGINAYINSCPLKFQNDSFIFVDKNLNKLDAAIFERNFREIGKELGLYKLNQKVQYRKYKCSCGKYEGKKYLNKICEKCDTKIIERKRSEQKKDKFSPHALRHSFGSHLLDNNVDIREIQKMMGHASIKDTEKYTLVNNEKLREQYMKFNPRDKIYTKN